MSSTILLIVLLSAHITGLISEQLLKATVGGSVLIPCSLPGYPLSLNWFYWQEGDNLFFRWDNGEEIEIKDNKYKGRFQVFTHEFSSGNISIRLDNISVEDDKNTFFTFVNLYDEQKKVTKQSQKQCIFMLQISAPYQDLVLTVNHTTNSATCSARGGYPAAQVSWKGLNRSSDEEQDLQDADTFLQQDPTEKTFSFTSSVNFTGLKSVTCIVYNPHSHESITETKKIDPEEGSHVAAIVGSVLAIIFLAGSVLLYWWYKKQRPVPGPVLELNPEPDVPNLQDAVQEEAPDLNPDAAREPVDLNPQDPVQEEAPGPDQDQDPDQAPGPDQDQDPDQAPGPDQDQDQDPDQAPANQPPAEHDPQDGAEAEDADAAEPAQDPVQEEAADPSEDTVLLSKDRAVYHCQTKTSEGTADCDTCEDAAASPEKEKLLEKENGNEDSASD